MSTIWQRFARRVQVKSRSDTASYVKHSEVLWAERSQPGDGNLSRVCQVCGSSAGLVIWKEQQHNKLRTQVACVGGHTHFVLRMIHPAQHMFMNIIRPSSAHPSRAVLCQPHAVRARACLKSTAVMTCEGGRIEIRNRPRTSTQAAGTCECEQNSSLSQDFLRRPLAGACPPAMFQLPGAFGGPLAAPPPALPAVLRAPPRRPRGSKKTAGMAVPSTWLREVPSLFLLLHRIPAMHVLRRRPEPLLPPSPSGRLRRTASSLVFVYGTALHG